MPRRDTIVVWLLPLVLIAVAGHQIWLASTRDLTSWKGGGFGMFASVDASVFRAVRGTLETSEGPVPLDVHALDDRELGPEAPKIFQNARALPDDRRLRPLAELVARSRWELVDGVAEHRELLAPSHRRPLLVARPGGDADAITVTGVRLEVWRVEYDRRTGTATPVPVGSYQLTTGPSGSARWEAR